MVSDGGGLAPAGGSEYTVVLRASSSAFFLPEEGWEHYFSLPGLALGTVRTRAFNRWVTERSISVPRELVIEVKGRAGTLDEAGAKFSMIARPIANMIAFVANVRVGPIFEIANSRKLLTPMRDSPNGHMAGLHCGECLIFLALDRRSPITLIPHRADFNGKHSAPPR